ncbi:MAG: hypothetical protein ACQEWU_04805 [Bacillota bacterium]|uniref:hypothetical protein n=1 Tax=unclassified Virgibacillus TaxID=2620237 RepID=UPI000EF4B9FA|nr:MULTISPECIES: hypothetical protein [unclassified Virgibacillus]MDY7042916.1 hypothetical protein [Virgibacillus sp. M23]
MGIKTNYSFVLLLVFTLFFAFQNNNVSAESTKISSEEISEITKHMKKDGISDSDIEKVIQKIKAGETLDSTKAMQSNEKMFFSNQDILESDNNGLISTLENSEPVTKMIKYDDGSYTKLQVDVLDDIIDNNTINRKIGNLASNGVYKTIKVCMHPY